MKKIEVVAAVIRDKDKIFTSQRAHGEFKGQWEFPGGKIEEGETKEQALIREIKEELDVSIKVDDFLCTVTHTYPDFKLTMHVYLCKISGGKIQLLEHADGKWLDIEDLDGLDWLEADIEVIEYLRSLQKQ